MYNYIFDNNSLKSFFFLQIIENIVVVRICRNSASGALSAKLRALTFSVEKFTSTMARPARELTVMRLPSICTTPTNARKNAPKGVRAVVEVVRIELTSYSAAKKLSTYLVYLLFLNFTTRVNTLCKTQKAK